VDRHRHGADSAAAVRPTSVSFMPNSRSSSMQLYARWTCAEQAVRGCWSEYSRCIVISGLIAVCCSMKQTAFVVLGSGCVPMRFSSALRAWAVLTLLLDPALSDPYCVSSSGRARTPTSVYPVSGAFFSSATCTWCGHAELRGCRRACGPTRQAPLPMV
jgi:hypothetical protein